MDQKNKGESLKTFSFMSSPEQSFPELIFRGFEQDLGVTPFHSQPQ